MAPKRKAVDAFGGSKDQLSAFAAARKSRVAEEADQPPPENSGSIATALAASSYSASRDEDVPLARPVDLDQSRPVFESAEPVQNGVSQDYTDFKRDSGQGVFLIGEYDVQVLKGLFTLYGATLTPNSGQHRVFAPSTHGIPQILSRKDASVVRATHVKSPLKRLGRVSPLFRNIWDSDESSQKSFVLAGHNAEDLARSSLSSLDIERDIQGITLRLSNKIANDLPDARIMTVGAKSAGKSTLNRVICNALVTRIRDGRVNYLDLDPGQPEFGVPGQLSLVEVCQPILGPSFSHPAAPRSKSFRLIRAHNIAATSFKDDPAHYTACVRDLLQRCTPGVPVIVNSCGWVVGLGASVLEEMTRMIAVSDIVVFDPTDDDLVSSLKQASKHGAVHRLARRPVRPAMRTPAELRHMQTLAYFHHRFAPPKPDWSWSAAAIDTFRPYHVSYAGDRGVLGIISYGQVPDSRFLHEVLNGSLVAIVTVDESHLGQKPFTATTTRSADTSQDIERTAEGLPHIKTNEQGFCHALDPHHSEFVGLGLVRGIDVGSKQLHIVTPVDKICVSKLSEKRVVLVRGGFDLPEWAYLESLYLSGDSIDERATDRPWVGSKAMVGIEGAVWRLRHPPMANSTQGPR